MDSDAAAGIVSRGLLLACGLFGVATALAFPRARLAFAPQLVVEGAFLAVSVVGLVALPRLAAPGESSSLALSDRIFVPLAVGFGGYTLRGVTDMLDEVLSVPEWYLSVFKDGSLVVGSLAFVVGIYWWADERRRRERALRERERELERQNRRLETFASVVSHDLRNPLNVVKGYTESLPPAVDDSAVESMTASLERMETIVADVLQLAQLGSAAVDATSVDLDAVARSAWGEVETGDATLAVDGGGAVTADEGLLQQLLENLFRNAVEHGASSGGPGGCGTPASGGGGDGSAPGPDDAAGDGGEPAPPLTVRVGATPDGFYVADDGRGIPDDEREAVLERGYTTSSDGTGLGLAIVTEIADVHDWAVSVGESEAGGARFEFRT